MKLREIKIISSVVLSPEQTVREVAGIFLKHQVDGAPVVDKGGKIIGLFTKDQIYRLLHEELNPHTLVVDLMIPEYKIGHLDDELEDMLNDEFEWLPIVDDNQVIGMITRNNLSKVFFDFYREISCELETIINSTYNLIVSVDEEGKIKVFNKSAEKFLGMEAKEMKGKNVAEVFPDSGLAEVVRTGKVELLQKVKLNNNYYISNRSPIIKDKKVIGAVAVIQCISEMEKISRELETVKDLNEELQAIIESSFDGLYVTDGNGLTLRLNKAYERITGIKADKFLGRYVDDIINDGIVSQSVTTLALQQKETVSIIQEYQAGKTTLATGNPVFDKKGNIFRVVCNVRDITELNQLNKELEKARSLSQHYQNQLRSMRYSVSDKLVVKSDKMRDFLELVIRLAQVDSTILITGESGTGKEVIAETLYSNSNRRDGPFIKINCGAIPENLLESELFGYEHGAFTGASKEGKAGYFELANGGVLFLDEIGELPLNLQVKLLRVLQSKEFVRVGGGKPLKIDIRILAATNRNLREMVAKKEFREDLFYRLNVIPVNVPPLRERKEEITAFVTHFMLMFNRKYKLNKRITPEVVDLFLRYDWPGNIRELENLVERLIVISSGKFITINDLPAHIRGGSQNNLNGVHVSGIIPLKDAAESAEKQVLERAYAEFRTIRQVAKTLKVSAATVVRKAAKYGITQNYEA
ncbi:sigma-54-dependent Fis family transcriptional regulator [Desulfotomaculum defluvii]